MFNAEKLLGGMLRSGMRGKGMGMGSLMKGGAALGLLGVAMEAVDHYMNRSQSTASSPPPVPGAGNPPDIRRGGAPPPPPGSGRAAVPPPPPGAASGKGANDAVLLIRAMIAAANADGVIDAQERGRIMEKLQAVDLSGEEHQFIVQELLAPKAVQSLVQDVGTPEMARQVYAVSLLAIEVDTAAEQQYMADLAGWLGLDSGSVEQIHRQLGK